MSVVIIYSVLLYYFSEVTLAADLNILLPDCTKGGLTKIQPNSAKWLYLRRIQIQIVHTWLQVDSHNPKSK